MNSFKTHRALAHTNHFMRFGGTGWFHQNAYRFERKPQRRRGASGAGEPAGGEEQHAPILGRRGAVQTHQRQFITRERTSLTGNEIAKRGVQHLGDSLHIVTNLAGTVGFPLRDGGARDVQFGREFVLREIGSKPQSPNPSTNSFCRELFSSCHANYLAR
jgi:hypothetical protein